MSYAKGFDRRPIWQRPKLNSENFHRYKVLEKYFENIKYLFFRMNVFLIKTVFRTEIVSMRHTNVVKL